MTTTDEMAAFVVGTGYDDLDGDVVDGVKRRVLDSVGIAIGALGAGPVESVRETALESSGGADGGCRLWGSDERASPADAAMYDTALVRYLDFMDSFLAPGETPHPSDNIAAAVVCAEAEGRSGEELIAAIAVAYEIQGALAWAAPVRDRGWDHVTHTIFSATAAAAKTLGLDEAETEHALSIAGTAHNALRVTRTGRVSMWKGIASANTARNAVYSAMLARNGMEGPDEVFDGQKGWKETVSGPFEPEYTPGEQLHNVMAKRYVAETYAQSAVEGVIEMIEREGIDPGGIERIDLETFAGAKLIIGGGEGDRYEVEEKSQADHSLPYMLAVAALDGTVMNEQYETERIRRDDVQELLRRVTVMEDPELTDRFEDGEMPAVVAIETEDDTYRIEKSSFKGHPSNPMDWEELEAKFAGMAKGRYDEDRREEIVATVKELDERDAAELVALLD